MKRAVSIMAVALVCASAADEDGRAANTNLGLQVDLKKDLCSRMKAAGLPVECMDLPALIRHIPQRPADMNPPDRPADRAIDAAKVRAAKVTSEQFRFVWKAPKEKSVLSIDVWSKSGRAAAATYTKPAGTSGEIVLKLRPEAVKGFTQALQSATHLVVTCAGSPKCGSLTLTQTAPR